MVYSQHSMIKYRHTKSFVQHQNLSLFKKSTNDEMENRGTAQRRNESNVKNIQTSTATQYLTTQRSTLESQLPRDAYFVICQDIVNKTKTHQLRTEKNQIFIFGDRMIK